MTPDHAISIDGHRIYCDVVPMASGGYTIEVTTQQGAFADEQVWHPKGQQVYPQRETAERDARALLARLMHVRRGGEPEFDD